ncbi:MAG: 16S rRNA (guanine(527)-N(7))-methyltransferase RsmG [Candidatus Sulfotelmatobacter sp.]
MHPARIAELLEPFLPASSANDQRPTVNDTLYQHISTYIDILLRWNARINLTSIRDPEQIVTRHFGESFFAARHLFPSPAAESGNARVGTGDSPVHFVGSPAAREGHDFSRADTVSGKHRALAPEGSANDDRPTTNDAISVADLGSGAGFPGIPIKLWAPHLTLTLIESNHKKTAFLREIVRALTLTNINVFSGRADHLLPPEQSHDQTEPRQQLAPLPRASRESQAPPGRFDLVTLRAVERFTTILPVADSLISPGGRLALLIGTSQLDTAQGILPALAWDPPLPVPQSQSRTLLIGHLRQVKQPEMTPLHLCRENSTGKQVGNCTTYNKLSGKRKLIISLSACFKWS